MNPTIVKFGYPATLLAEFDHWLVLLRPTQVTLGSMVLAAKSDATAFAGLPPAAFAELHLAVGAIESALTAFRPFARINYLMLMIVDRQVHFHVIPRFTEPQRWNGLELADMGWPGPPDLGGAKPLPDDKTAALIHALREAFA